MHNTGNIDSAPCIEQLRSALRVARVFAGTPQNHEAIKELQRLRDQKCAWVGADECALRLEIDKHLRGEGQSWT